MVKLRLAVKIAWKENVDSNVIVETKDDQWYVGT